MASRMVIEGSDGVTASQLKEFHNQINRGMITGLHLQKFLEANKDPIGQLPFRYFMRCKIGTKNRAQFQYLFYNTKLMYIQPEVYKAWDDPRFSFSETEEELILVSIYVQDLGLKDYVRYSEIFPKAIGQIVRFEGEYYTVDFCPPDTALYLRLQYMDQPQQESLYIGSRIIAQDTYDSSIYSVTRHSMPGIGFGVAPAEGEKYYAGSEFVFCLRKKSK